MHITGPQHVVVPPVGDVSDPPYVVVSYVEEMQYAYAAADLAVCRAGAMTCAELAAVGLPAAYVPLPLRGAEQRLNPTAVVAAGGALAVRDAAFTAGWIETSLIPLLTDPHRLETMSERALSTYAPDAGAHLARRALTVIADRREALRQRGGRRWFGGRA